MAADYLLLLPELLLVLGVLLVTLVGRAQRDRWAISLLVVLLSLATTFWMLVPGDASLQNLLRLDQTVAYGFYEATPFALAFKLVFLGVAAMVLVANADYLRNERETGEFYALLLSATVGMMVVASARDLVTLFVGLETSSLSTFVLVGFRRTQPASTEASLKFFVIGSLSAALTWFGVSLVYAVAGTVDLYQLAAVTFAGGLRGPYLLAIAFLIGGLGFKITTVPFHMWAPDVYHGAPGPVSAFLAGGSKKMGLAALFKIFFVGLVAAKVQADILVGVLAVLTMTLGNIVALQQTSLKRLLAWSSIAHAGYILIAFPVGTVFALTAAYFHVVTHALMTGGAFLLVAALSQRGFGDTLESYRGLGRRHPLAAFMLALVMLSLAGVPPLAGFASKFVLFGSAVEAGLARGNWWLLSLAVAGVLNSALSLVYYVRVVRVTYAEETTQPLPRLALPATVTFLVSFVLVALVLFGVWPQPILQVGRLAAESLLGLTP